MIIRLLFFFFFFLFTSALVLSSYLHTGDEYCSGWWCSIGPFFFPFGAAHDADPPGRMSLTFLLVPRTCVYIYCLSLPRDGQFSLLFSSSSDKAFVYWLIHHFPYFCFPSSIDSNIGNWLTIHSFIYLPSFYTYTHNFYPTFSNHFSPYFELYKPLS